MNFEIVKTETQDGTQDETESFAPLFEADENKFEYSQEELKKAYEDDRKRIYEAAKMLFEEAYAKLDALIFPQIKLVPTEKNEWEISSDLNYDRRL